MNVFDILLIILIAAVFCLAVRASVKRRKSGGCGCGCGGSCAGCRENCDSRGEGGRPIE